MLKANKFPIYSGKTGEGKIVTGNLIYTKDVVEGFSTIIIPVEDNGMYSDDDLGFEVWYQVDEDSVELIGYEDINPNLTEDAK